MRGSGSDGSDNDAVVYTEPEKAMQPVGRRIRPPLIAIVRPIKETG